MLAVVTFAIFANGEKPSLKKILKDIVTNPLIIGVLSGLFALGLKVWFNSVGVKFVLTDIEPIGKTLSYLSGLATPLALLALGAQFEFSDITSMKREIIVAVVMRCFAVPLLGLGGAYLLFKNVDILLRSILSEVPNFNLAYPNLCRFIG